MKLTLITANKLPAAYMRLAAMLAHLHALPAVSARYVRFCDKI
ncbi:MAG: hypothetical protein ABIO05_00345 [Ferruginibacter sp.]